MNSREIRIAIDYIAQALEDVEKILSVYAKPTGSRGVKNVLVDTILLKDLQETNNRLKEVVSQSDDDDDLFLAGV